MGCRRVSCRAGRVSGGRRGWRRAGRGSGCGGRRGRALGLDQLGEPAHLALGRVQAVPLQLGGVEVEALAAPRGGGADRVEPLLEPAAATLEDPQPDRGLGAGEEGEVHVERAVLPGGRAGLGDQRLEVVLAVGGELVDDARPPAAGRRRRGRAGRARGLGDPAAAEQVAQARVEGAVGQRAERPEHRVEALAQLVAVHRGVVQEAEDRQLEQGAAAAHRRPPVGRRPGWAVAMVLRVVRCLPRRGARDLTKSDYVWST